MKKNVLALLAFALCFGIVGCASTNLGGKEKVPECTDGIRLSLEQFDDGVNYKCGIDRVNLTTGEKVWWHIGVTDFSVPYVIDYFVNPGDSYEYHLRYFTMSNEEFVKEVVVGPVVAETGVGEIDLSYLSSLSCSYDNKYNRLVFDQDVALPDHILQKLEKTGVCGGLTARFEDGRDSYVMDPELEKEMNLESLLYSFKNSRFLGGKIYLDSIQLNTIAPYNNGVTYFETFDISSIPNLMKVFTVKDSSKPLEVVQNEYGFELIIPENIVKGCDVYAVSRENITTGESVASFISFFDIPDVIIDPFVKPGNKYRYEMRYVKNDRTIGATKYSKVMVAESGVGDLAIPEKVDVSYNEKTGVMTFNPVIDFSVYKDVLKKAFNCSAPNIRVKLAYYGSDNWIREEIDGAQVNWVNVLKGFSYIKGGFNKYYDFRKLEVTIELMDKCYYRFMNDVYPEFAVNYFNNLPMTIFIPGN